MPAKASTEPSAGRHEVGLLRPPSVGGPTRTSRRPGPGSAGGRTSRAKARLVATVSARALIMRAAPRRVRRPGGTSPHRADGEQPGAPLRRWPAGPAAPGRSARRCSRRPTGRRCRRTTRTARSGRPRSGSSRTSRTWRHTVTPAATGRRPGCPANRESARGRITPRRRRRQNVTVGNLTATRPPQPWTAPTATDPVAATLRLPGSKSMTARALVLGALAGGPSTLRPAAARPGHRADGRRPARDGRARVDRRRRALAGPAAAAASARPTSTWAWPARSCGSCRRWPGWPTGRSPSTATRTPATGPLGPLIGALRSLGVRIDAAADRRPAAGRARRRPGHRRRGGDRRLRVQPARLRPAAGRARASTGAWWSGTSARRCRPRRTCG